MIYYKSVRCIDGKVIWVVEDEHGNISRNPTKDQLKIAIYDNRKRPQEYDTLFLVCMDHNEPWKDVNRVYAIPWEVVVNRGKGNIVITRDSSRGTWYDDPIKWIQWYEKYRVTDEDMLRKVNEIWKKIVDGRTNNI